MCTASQIENDLAVTEPAESDGTVHGHAWMDVHKAYSAQGLMHATNDSASARCL